MNTDTLRYAGFWPRLAANFLDVLIIIPFGIFWIWGKSHFRLFPIYYFIPGIVSGFFYSVYLVRRYGGTPGKLIMGIRIRKLGGETVGYREAFLRYLPDAFLGVLVSLALFYSLLHISDTEYLSLSRLEQSKRINELAPPWRQPLYAIQKVWIWGEFIVLLTNHKKRAIHDFIAGTVVVHAPPKVASSAVTDTAISV